MKARQRIEQLLEARQAQQAAALDHLVRLFTPEEAEALVAVLEAGLNGHQVSPDVEQQLDTALARVWTTVPPEVRVSLVRSTNPDIW